MSNIKPPETKHSIADPEPSPPVAPQPGDCCGEGCANCVLDQYDAAMERYEVDLAAWKAKQQVTE